MEETEYDKVTQASLNGIYVKAQEMDRGHNDVPAPSFHPPGARVDATTRPSVHAGDSASHASDAGADAADAEAHASDRETHASDAQTHASDGGGGGNPRADGVSW